ncbi:MAG TPA: carboxypeptidase-like regulatory domain-containing protein [Gemmatimonadaceae bacterium]|nr:carboxypeptidase-like regulatory domain-containing protein [Gemmatimonadaceae bacterium]
MRDVSCLQGIHRAIMLMLMAAALVIGASTRSAAQDSTSRGAAHDTLSNAHAAATLPRYRYRVLGVFDSESGQPVEGADVINLLTGVSEKTSSTGTIALTFLPDGGGMVRIRKLGYEMQTRMVAISPADTAPVTVVLSPVVRLPEVTTHSAVPSASPNLRGFEERRERSASGQFVTDSVLRKEDTRALANVLRSHVSGINIVQRGRFALLEPGPSCQTEFGERTPAPPDVYLDGMLLPHPPAPPNRAFLKGTGDVEPFDLAQFSVTDLAGVEWYPETSMAPPQFSHTSKGCGVLLLWTRVK